MCGQSGAGTAAPCLTSPEASVWYLCAGAYNRPMHDVVVYSRKGCHLCDVVKDTLAQLQGDADFHWREVDIDADPELRLKL
jgi:hypothetical protein